MTTPHGIVCLPDLLRGVNSFSTAFFDLVREPIHQGAGLTVGCPPGGKKPHSLAPGFDVAEFRTRAGAPPTYLQRQRCPTGSMVLELPRSIGQRDRLPFRPSARSTHAAVL